MFRVECNITGSEIAKQKLFKIEKATNDFTVPFGIINTWFEKFQIDTFASEGADTGRKWAPLSESYRQWKSKRFPGKGILERTGDLKSSLTGTAAYTKKIITPMVFTRGTSAPYSSYHQTGYTVLSSGGGFYKGGGGPGKIKMPVPARPFIRMQKAFWDKVNEILAWWINGGTWVK